MVECVKTKRVGNRIEIVRYTWQKGHPIELPEAYTTTDAIGQMVCIGDKVDCYTWCSEGYHTDWDIWNPHLEYSRTVVVQDIDVGGHILYATGLDDPRFPKQGLWNRRSIVRVGEELV